MEHADAGRRAPKNETDLEPPAELVDALGADPQLAAAFEQLTPGRRKSYVIALQSAKKPSTRAARVERFREKILAGKGAMER